VDEAFDAFFEFHERAVWHKIGDLAFDALTDRSMDRNLFPFEMLLWTGIATPGILTGNLTGCLIYWVKKKWHNKASQVTSQ
jgi:hypothetical protein